MPADLMAFLAQPFSADMSAVHWFLFLGLIIVLLWGWHQVFREIHAVSGALT